MWTALLFVGVSVAMLFALQFWSAKDVDFRDRTKTETVVANGIRGYAAEAARKALPQANWDDAVVNLDRKFDPIWARTFLAEYLKSIGGVQTVLVADAENRVIYAYANGRDQRPIDMARFDPEILPLIGEVRRAETLRGPLPPLPLPPGERLKPILSYSIARIDDRLYLLSASLVQPDDVILPRTARAPIIIAAEDLNDRLAVGIGNQFLLKDSKLVIGASARPRGVASVALRDRAGTVVARLQWTPSSPGALLLRTTLGATIIFSLALCLLVAWFVWRGARLAGRLVDSEAEAARLAYQDSLTGLANRAQFGRAFANMASASRGRGFALFSIDLDRFKSVNDSFGHAAGDELICAVAARLRGCCDADDVLIRFGGDEFVLLCRVNDEKTAHNRAKRIIEELAAPFTLGDHRVFTGASIGIALAVRGQSASETLRRADLALYVAKARGRGAHALFEDGMDAGVRERSELNTRLHEAIEAGRLTLAYQPQVGRDGRVFGLEALARWTEPGLGPVSPTTFVELAEESGLIDSLGYFALRRAFEDSRRWPAMRVAVNVSALQLRQRDFVERVHALAVECAADPAQFDIEITERVLIGEDRETLDALAALRSLGFRIFLDDFGTGYSNLSSLQRYPIDKVKIDRSFVARIGHEPNAEAMIIAMVRLARALGVEVIAEGVETEAQRLCLTVAGCAEIQGYLTGRPMTADDAEALIRSAGEAEGDTRASG